MQFQKARNRRLSRSRDDRVTVFDVEFDRELHKSIDDDVTVRVPKDKQEHKPAASEEAKPATWRDMFGARSACCQ